VESATSVVAFVVCCTRSRIAVGAAQKEPPVIGGFFALVAGAGFEPTNLSVEMVNAAGTTSNDEN
jgi:hypothetical protein